LVYPSCLLLRLLIYFKVVVIYSWVLDYLAAPYFAWLYSYLVRSLTIDASF
jgi:hypothetical protein